MTYGLVAATLAPLRAEPNHRSEMVSQLLLWETVRILNQSGEWLLVQNDYDDYIGWLTEPMIKELSEKELESFKARPKMIVTQFPCANATLFNPRNFYVPTYPVFGTILPCEQKNDTQTKDKASFSVGVDLIGLEESSCKEYKAAKKIEAKDCNKLIKIAKNYLNTPYLWGGRSPFGIDCSGLIQMIFRQIGFSLPRDAYQQVELGEPIEFDDRKAGDLAFFKNDQGKVSHIGILSTEDYIIHASHIVKEDNLIPEGIYCNREEKLTHTLHIIKRL